jgi:ribosomal-protein-alanine N-acetyltransferase
MMKMGVTVEGLQAHMLRPIKAEDLPQLHEIEIATQPFPWPLETFQQCLAAGFGGWVLEQNAKILGFILVTLQAGEGHILNICVHTDYQRQGIAAQLFNAVLSAAKQGGINRFFLEVRCSNHQAIGLYTKFGFQQIGVRKDYYLTASGHEDALVFAKEFK